MIARRVGTRTLGALALGLALATATCDWGAGLESAPVDAGAGGGVMTATFIDVGQGDAALFELPGGEVVLIDGGDDGMGELEVLPLLADKGIDRIDLMILTHPHADHVGGLDEVLAGVEVLEVWGNGEEIDSLAWRDYVAAVEAFGGATLVPERGYERRFGTVAIEVLSGPPDDEGENDDSLVVMISHGAVSFLMTGDVEVDGQGELQRDYEDALDCEVVKVPHHGSKYFDPAFVEAASPEIAVISSGVGNVYGHPHDEALEAWAEIGAAVCRTDLFGDIEVSSDGATVASDCP